jgi:hypothetical protein
LDYELEDSANTIRDIVIDADGLWKTNHVLSSMHPL